jgi:hypothetical protein
MPAKTPHFLAILALLLALCGCSQTQFTPAPRPATATASAEYVGGPDGGVWVELSHLSGPLYRLTFFHSKGKSTHTFKLVRTDGTSNPISTADLSGWDGAQMHLTNAQGQLVRAK